MANKIKLARGTKENIELKKDDLLDYEIVYSKDDKEIGVKNADGTITYFLNKERTAKVDEENDFTELQTFNSGIYTGTITMDSYARIVGLGDGIDPQDAVTKAQLDRKVDKNVFVWNDTGTTLNVYGGEGIVDLPPPYNTIAGSHIFATEQEALSSPPASYGLHALVTGFKWVSASVGEYNAAGYKIDKTANIGGVHREADANYLVVPSYELWDIGQWSVVLKIADPEITTSYWKLVQIYTTAQESPKVYKSVGTETVDWEEVVNKPELYDKTEINSMLDDKVDKTLTIIGLDLQDNILLGEFRTALGNATQSVAGLLSAEDKTHLDTLVALLETNDDNNVVDTIGEILAIFQDYPEGVDLVTALAGKLDIDGIIDGGDID